MQKQLDWTGENVQVFELESGAYWRVQLDAPKANILDAVMLGSLTEVFARAKDASALQAICIEGNGPHFSFGASVEEHLPDQVASMLETFHGVFRAMAASSITLLSAVRGQCLGGGLELASFCHRVFASPDSKLGQPEIVLGVFPPVAALLLPERVGRAHAEDLCLSGRVLAAEEAMKIGLVDELGEDPSAAALEYAKKHLLPHSASSLRHTVAALRRGFDRRFFAELEQVERIYLEELMATHDAKEGIQAFLGRRKPEWSNE